MKRGYTTNTALFSEVLTEIDYTGKINEPVIKRQIDDAVRELIDTEQLSFAVSILEVKNFKAVLPDGFHSIYLVASSDNPKKYLNREEVIGWREKVFGTDCQVEVNLLCPKCGNDKCSHPVIELDMDRLYKESRPYLWAMDNRYIGYSAAMTDGFPTPEFSVDFKIMRPRSTQMALWNSEYFLGICNSLPSTGCYTYDISPPEFLTDLKDGQVYISYLKYLKDDEGYHLIPDFPEVITAVKDYVICKMMRKLWLKDGNQSDRLRYIDMKNAADTAMNQARSILEVPNADNWNQIMNKHYVVPRDRYHYGG